MKTFIAILFFSWGLSAQAYNQTQEETYKFFGVSGENYQDQQELLEHYDEKLIRRYGDVQKRQLSDHLVSRQDLQGQLQALRRTMKINEEVIVRVMRDPQQVIDVRIEDHELLISYASSIFGMAVNTIGRIMYLGMPQSTSEVISEAQMTIERLKNNEVHEIYIYTDYKLKASMDSRHQEAFIYHDKIQSLEQLSTRMSKSYFYYGGITNSFKSPVIVDTKIIDLFEIKN